MKKQRILRICHKFLINNDGYDLDIQDLCSSTSFTYDNFVLTYINIPLNDYIKKNNIIIKNGFYYHKGSKAYIYPLTYKKFYNMYLRDLYVLKNVKKFLSSFKEVFKLINPNIVHIHGTLLFQFLYPAIYTRKKCKVFATHHIGSINQNQNNQKISVLLLKYLIHNTLPFFCKKIISVSSHSRNSFKFYRKNVLVVNPIPRIPVNLKATFKNILDCNVLANKFKIKKNDNVFCCIGRVSSQKNQLNIIKSFNKVLEKRKDYKLLLIGKINNNQYYKNIKKEINRNYNNYCLINEVDNKKAINVIENSDYLIAASHNEGFGRNAMEALLLGKPVIVSKRTGFEDFVEEGANGLFVDPNNIDEIKSAIENINDIKVKNKYSHESYINEMIEVYRG